MSVANFRIKSEANFERLNLVMQTGGGDLIMSNARQGKILKEIPLSFDALGAKRKEKGTGGHFFVTLFNPVKFNLRKGE